MKLVITLNREPYETHQLPDGNFTWIIGRTVDNDIVLSDSQFYPETTGNVSRKHATIQRIGNNLIFIDNDTLNGTWIKGKRIDRQIITPSEIVHIGMFGIKIMEN